MRFGVVHLNVASYPFILKTTTMKLFKEDISRIGYDWVETEEGNLEIFSNCEECGMVEILLRNILEEFGDYRIVQDPTFEEGGKLTSGYVTNLPFNLFKEAHANFLKQYKEQEGYV
jgi:hypothetical protein